MHTGTSAERCCWLQSGNAACKRKLLFVCEVHVQPHILQGGAAHKLVDKIAFICRYADALPMLRRAAEAVLLHNILRLAWEL